MYNIIERAKDAYIAFGKRAHRVDKNIYYILK